MPGGLRKLLSGLFQDTTRYRPKPSNAFTRSLARRARESGADLQSATDPEGRSVLARFLVGLKDPSGAGQSLPPEDIRRVAKIIADDVFLDPVEKGVDPAGGRTWGVPGGYLRNSWERLRPPQALAIVSPDDPQVLAHETGHGIAAATGMMSPSEAALPGWLMRHGIIGHPDEADEMLAEMERVSRARRPEQWAYADGERPIPGWASEQGYDTPEKWQTFLGGFDELLADSFEHYMRAPDEFKAMAPLTGKFIRALVNEDRHVGPVVSFLSLGGIGAPVLLNGADQRNGV